MKHNVCPRCKAKFSSDNHLQAICFACLGEDRQKELDAIAPVPTNHPDGKARPVLLEDDLNMHRSDWLHDPPIGQKIETGFRMLGEND